MAHRELRELRAVQGVQDRPARGMDNQDIVDRQARGENADLPDIQAPRELLEMMGNLAYRANRVCLVNLDNPA